MKHASLRRFALALSRQVTARIRSWWLNGTVTLWRIHAACSEIWLLGCNHKSNTGSKDQKQKFTKERSHEDTHHGFDSNFQRRLWNTLREGARVNIYGFPILPRNFVFSLKEKKTEAFTDIPNCAVKNYINSQRWGHLICGTETCVVLTWLQKESKSLFLC